jgi:hypothetical protein
MLDKSFKLFLVVVVILATAQAIEVIKLTSEVCK